MNKEKIIYASDITECEECPLYGHDCRGGWSSSGAGTPIEPPCCSWNGDEEIYEGMYDCDYRDYEAAETSYKEKQAYEREEQEKQRKEELKRRLDYYDNYVNTKVKDEGVVYEKWFCPHCRNWSYVDWSLQSMFDDIAITRCPICNTGLKHAYGLGGE